jgi:GT2 family glycosyltransferase
MVTFGGWEWTKKSLAALVENTDPVYEVIVVDNASPEGTGWRLQSEVTGITLVLNDHNAGFGPAANQGAGLASGRFVCFLNPDALVQRGWLDPLIEAVETDPLAGAAVPRLLNLDGTLQEAGSLVGFDGGTWALGNGEDPDDFQYRFRRYVDYGSAACLLMPRELFIELGGFHPAYVPAYCEDVELCLSISARGLRTVYQPRSVVRHARSASTDLERAHTLIERNRRILYHRWKDRLGHRPWLADLPYFPHRIIAARDAEHLDRILLILDHVPTNDGEDPNFTLVHELAYLWPAARMTLVAADAGNASEEAIRPLLDAGVEVIVNVDDWQDWFAQRRYHYSVVILGGAANVERFGEVIRATQPQATRVYYAEDRPDDDSVRWAQAVFSPKGASRESVATISPGASLFELNDGRGLRRSLIEAMANLGVEPPDPNRSSAERVEAAIR